MRGGKCVQGLAMSSQASDTRRFWPPDIPFWNTVPMMVSLASDPNQLDQRDSCEMRTLQAERLDDAGDALLNVRIRNREPEPRSVDQRFLHCERACAEVSGARRTKETL